MSAFQFRSLHISQWRVEFQLVYNKEALSVIIFALNCVHTVHQSVQKEIDFNLNADALTLPNIPV